MFVVSGDDAMRGSATTRALVDARQTSAQAGLPGGLAGFTHADLDLLVQVLKLEKIWKRRACKKRSFGMLLPVNVATQVPWQGGGRHIGSLIIPNGEVWLGGDGTVTSLPGTTAGIPLIAGAAFALGEEEGASETWLISSTTATETTDVRCLELLE